MNFKRIWLVLPTAFSPYVALFTLATVFGSTKLAVFRWVMEDLFGGNALLLIACFLAFCIVAATLSVVCFFLGVGREWDSLSLVKTAMIIKLLQIPAYLLIFVLGAVMVISIFTIPFAIGLFLFDCVALASTGLLTVAAVVISVRRRILTREETVWIVISQVFFCADVVGTICLFLKLRKKNGHTG